LQRYGHRETKIAPATHARGDFRSSVQNLLDATELMAEAYLFTVPASGIRSARTHPTTKSKFNQERKRGRVHDSFSALLNRLGDLRGAARYLEKDFELDPGEAETMLATAAEMHRAAL
jgi:hypothetical protein